MAFAPSLSMRVFGRPRAGTRRRDARKSAFVDHLNRHAARLLAREFHVRRLNRPPREPVQELRAFDERRAVRSDLLRQRERQDAAEHAQPGRPGVDQHAVDRLAAGRLTGHADRHAGERAVEVVAGRSRVDDERLHVLRGGDRRRRWPACRHTAASVPGRRGRPAAAAVRCITGSLPAGREAASDAARRRGRRTPADGPSSGPSGRAARS